MTGKLRGSANHLESRAPARDNSCRGADLSRVERLQVEYEIESARILTLIRTAHHDLACAYDKLHDGLALELYAARKERERRAWKRR